MSVECADMEKQVTVAPSANTRVSVVPSTDFAVRQQLYDKGVHLIGTKHRAILNEDSRAHIAHVTSALQLARHCSWHNVGNEVLGHDGSTSLSRCLQAFTTAAAAVEGHEGSSSLSPPDTKRAALMTSPLASWASTSFPWVT